MTNGSCLYLTMFFAVAVLTGAVHAQTWREELPSDRFRMMNQFQRTLYNRAMGMFRENQHRAAAAEWEKFRLEFERELNPELVGYLILMRARSLHEAKDRHASIREYTEVLDMFPDVPWVAAPSLYFRGMARFDNGDIRPAMLDMKNMVEDQRYRLHPLAAGALRRLADNHWRNKEPELAVRYWRQTYDDFLEANRDEAHNARDRVLAHYIKEQHYDRILSWFCTDDNRNDPRTRAGLAGLVENVAYHGFHGNWEKYEKDAVGKKRDMEAFWQWFKQERPWFEKTDMWNWYSSAVRFLCHRHQEKKERDLIIDEAIQFIRTAELDDRNRNDRYAWLCDRLREAGDLVMARLAAGSITDAGLAAWKEYEIIGHYENKWTEAARQLEAIKKMGDEQWSRRSLKELAMVHRDRLGDYETAIKLYQEISEPPQTLWEIQIAYQRWGKPADAQKTLTEIVAMFPDWAARAMYEKAEIYRRDGDKEKAVAHYRQILRHDDWKRAGEASLAHQRLEGYGIATGGGVIDEF